MRHAIIIASLLLAEPAYRAGDGTCLWWHEHHAAAEEISPGGSGATFLVGGSVPATTYWLLDATDEFLYFGSEIHTDWDGNSDIPWQILVALDEAETASDTINATLNCSYSNDHDNMDTAHTQTRSVDHNIGGLNAAGDQHELWFLLDHDLGGQEVAPSDRIACRFYLDSVASVVAVRVIGARMVYRTCYPHQAVGTFPTEC